MHQKIIDYVNYQFRFDKRENIESIKQEMIANLIDRYDDLISKGIDEKTAYIETVKRIGNLDETNENKVDDMYIQKPSWALVSMMTVSVLAIGGLALSLISNLVGLLITLGSIGLFATASYALYADSQHRRALEHDIDSQKSYFQIILKTFNRNYIIWSMAIAIVFSSLILNFIFLLSADSISQIVLEGSFGQVIAAFLFVWFIIFIILFVILKSLQGYLYKKYIYITGDSMSKEDPSQTILMTQFKQSYELVLFLYVMLTTLTIWALPISYYEQVNGGGFGFDTSYIGAIGDFPWFIMPVVLSIGVLIYMGNNLKTTKSPKWLLCVLSSITYIGYIVTILIHQNVLRGLLEARLTAISIFLMLSVIGQLIYFLSSINRKK